MRIVLALIQTICLFFLRNKKHYLNVPEDLISWIKVDRIYKFGHILPSVVITILIAVKVLPLISIDYANHLENNGTLIPITFFIVLIPVLIINGIIIEKILIMNNEKYREFVKRNKE
jgi:hypothetical protein